MLMPLIDCSLKFRIVGNVWKFLINNNEEGINVLKIYLCEIDLDRIGDLSDSNIVFALVGCSVLGENIKS